MRVCVCAHIPVITDIYEVVKDVYLAEGIVDDFPAISSSMSAGRAA